MYDVGALKFYERRRALAMRRKRLTREVFEWDDEPPSHPRGEALGEMADRRLDVLGAVPQRRHVDREDVQASNPALRVR
jgi:hypothetical protein